MIRASSSSGIEQRILILAPTGRDSQLISNSLDRAELDALVCANIPTLCDHLLNGAGAAIIAEEALTPAGIEHLSCFLAKQPAWSDFPLVVLCQGGQDSAEASWETIGLVESIGNATLLERPLREITLVSALEVALRSRRRQYQVRDYLKERIASEEALRESENRLRVQAEELDQRVRQRTSELVAANKELEGFTYSIAHDLRSPLRRLMFSSEIICQDYEGVLDSEGKQTLKQLSGEAKKLTRLVEDLLQYARLGQQPVKRSVVDVSKLSQSIYEGLLPECPADIDIEPNIEAKADPALLELVIRNLIDNSCKYRKPKEAHPHTWIGFDKDRQALFVRDNGIGFEMEFAAKIFAPFERLHRDAEFPGSGIGLANVKRIVERHGGVVWAESEPGKGTTFYLTLGEASEMKKKASVMAQAASLI